MQRGIRVLGAVLALLVACNRPPAGSEGETGGVDDLSWWIGPYHAIEGNEFKYSFVFDLHADGTFTYVQNSCEPLGADKTGGWEVMEDGELVALLNAAGTAPFTASNASDDGDEQLYFRRYVNGNGTCLITQVVGEATEGAGFQPGARCLAVGNDCLSEDLSVSAPFCDGAEPAALVCP